MLEEVRGPMGLDKAVDVGCGLGHFSGFLNGLGLDVVGVDGRDENVREASRRFPKIPFNTVNVENPEIRELGRFDLVLCFGLLYHLENPLLAIRNLHEMTSKLLIVESVVFPGTTPIMALVDESQTEDQGINHFAFYPTGACLTKMIYRAGFPLVYEIACKPRLPEYVEAKGEGPSRIMLAAGLGSVAAPSFRHVPEPLLPYGSWNLPDVYPRPGLLEKTGRFMKKPFSEKIGSIKRAVRGTLGRIA